MHQRIVCMRFKLHRITEIMNKRAQLSKKRVKTRSLIFGIFGIRTHKDKGKQKGKGIWEGKVLFVRKAHLINRKRENKS